jgi:hypothetical protein
MAMYLLSLTDAIALVFWIVMCFLPVIDATTEAFSIVGTVLALPFRFRLLLAGAIVDQLTVPLLDVGGETDA